MADVAGTAVGVISLGIQVCQGLVSYYHEYRDQDETITAILRDLSILSHGLEIIQGCIAKVCFQQANGTAQAEESIIACAAAIARLDQFLAKCRQIAGPTKLNVKERIQILSQKATFPFRKSTIQDLRNTVKDLQSNVILSLQALQLEVSSYLPENTSELLEHLKSTSTTFSRVQIDLSGLAAQVDNINSSLPELTNGTKDIARVVEEELPSLRQASSQIADEFPMVNRSILALSQQVSALNKGLEQNFSSVRQSIHPMPVMLEDAILAMLNGYQKHSTYPTVTQYRPEEASHARNLTTQLLKSPDLLRSCCERATQIENAFEDGLAKVENHISKDERLQGNLHISTTSCSCKAGAFHASGMRGYKSLTLFKSSYRSNTHSKRCPLHISARQKISVGFRYPYCGLLLSKMIEFSMTVTRGAGGLSISPSLTFRSIVSDDSPAFKLLNSRIDRWDRCIERNPEEKSIAQELWDLFEKRKASPSDIDSGGNTLLHIACWSAFSLSKSNDDSFREFRELILSLRQWDAGFNEIDNSGCRPLELMTRFGVFDNYYERVVTLSLELYHAGMEFSESWWPSLVWESENEWDQYVRNIFLYLSRNNSMGEVVDGLQCGPLSKAILQKSETQTRQILEEIPDSLHERNLVGHTPMHLSANWPAGISLLLRAGGNYLTHEPDNVGFLPLAYASYTNCQVALELLLDVDCSLYIDIVPFVERRGGFWEGIHRSRDIICDAMESSSEDVLKSIVEALADRRRRLALIASQELSHADIERFCLHSGKVLDFNAAQVYKLLQDKKVAMPRSLFVPVDWNTIYHLLLRKPQYQPRPLENPTKWADIFWDAGFRDIDVRDENGEDIFVYFPDYPEYLKEEKPGEYLRELLELYVWLLDRGANLGYKTLRRSDNGVRIPHTPATFYVGRTVVSWLPNYATALSSTTRFRLQCLLTQITSEKATDDCKCACSFGGCTAITVMLKALGEDASGRYRLKQLNFSYVSWFIDLLDSSIGGWNFIKASVIRFLTFDCLELTHTCCEWQGDEEYYFATFDEDDRIEIHEEENEDIETLSELFEEFYHACVGLRLPLVQFLHQYWAPRMDRVMNSGKMISEDEARKVRELGVSWEPRQPSIVRFAALTMPASYEYECVIGAPKRVANVTRRRKSI